MRSTKWLAHVAIVAGLAGALSAACTNFYEDAYVRLTDQALAVGGSGGSGGSGGTGGASPGCIPTNITGAVDDTCGVFVSASIGNDVNDGTKEAPFATIEKALGSAKGKPVYLCGESFDEALTLSAGTLVYGALDCATDWRYVASKRSAVAPLSESVAINVTSKASVELYDIDITASDATTPGSSSIALLAEGDTDVILTRSNVTAGKGAAGADGVAFDMPATAGEDGLVGQDACTGAMLFGGASIKNTCDADESISGAGGIGQEASGGDGSKGLPDGAINGGAGEGAMACTNGTVGDAGASGEPGAGASGLGSLSSEGFTGVAGGDGQPGKIAQGGGGGGGAKGGATGAKCNAVMNAAGNAGASGGSGGAGGCGGLGGKGGGSGGASIGVLSLGAVLSFESVTITTKTGGKGGNGGDGQTGGPGGQGGVGGTVPMGATDLKPGCAGGPGGAGGTGGKGGGGLGGHSIGVAHTGAAPSLEGVQIVLGVAGTGGTGDGATGNGAAGVAAQTQKF